MSEKPMTKVEELLYDWNTYRLELAKVQEEMLSVEARIAHLKECMRVVPIQLENLLFNLEQPLGLRIDDDYIVVVQDTHCDNFIIQTVDFNLRQEIKNS